MNGGTVACSLRMRVLFMIGGNYSRVVAQLSRARVGHTAVARQRRRCVANSGAVRNGRETFTLLENFYPIRETFTLLENFYPVGKLLPYYKNVYPIRKLLPY